MNLINCLPCLLQGIKRNVSDGNTGQSNERSIQTAINSEKSYLLLPQSARPVSAVSLGSRLLLGALASEVILERQNALFIGLH